MIDVVPLVPYMQFDPVKLKKLGPTFKTNGSVTAGNSSSIRFVSLLL